MIGEVLSRLNGVRRTRRGWEARCPAHADRSPSLSLTEGDDRRVLLHDHGGCRPTEIVAALGLTLADLFPDPRRPIGPRPVSPASLLGAARREILLDARRQMARLAPYREVYADAESVRVLDRTVTLARRLATAHGPDSDSWWELLVQAATLETEARELEARLDAEGAPR